MAARGYAGADGEASWLSATRVRAYCMYSACMVAIQIRDVSEQVRDVLAGRAAERGQSLQTYLLALVEADARRARNRAVLDRFEALSDGVIAQPGETSAEVSAARVRRERTLSGQAAEGAEEPST